MDTRVLILAGAFMGVSLGIFVLMMVIIKNFIQDKKKVLIYAALFILAFALISLIGYKGLIPHPGTLLFVFQACFLLLGIVHSKAVYHYFDWSRKSSFLPEFVFSVFIWLIGLIPFLLIFSAVNDSGYHYLMLGASLFFIIPLLFTKAFESALSVPFPDMKRWFYPVNTKIPEPEEDELRSPRVVSFILYKKQDDKKLTDFRAKAPSEMELGRLFYYFMDDYNQKNVEHTIDFADRFGRPHGWLFYFKPRWFRLYKKRYVDPDLSVNQNHIRENSMIVCQRVEHSAEMRPLFREKYASH